MPKFYHSGDPDLSDLNRAKMQVNSDYAKQYKSQDGNHDNLGQTEDKGDIFNMLSTRLTGLYTALTDLAQQINSPLAISTQPIKVFTSTVVAGLQQLASRILIEIRAIQAIMGRIKNFNMFTPPQAQQLQQFVQEISEANDTIIGASQFLGTSDTAKRIDSVIQTYAQEFQYLMQFLTGASNNYKSIEVIGSGRLIGGAIVPAYNGHGVYGSDGYTIGDYHTYTNPRRFY
jgi:methyl-accepting chemotaxis protein